MVATDDVKGETHPCHHRDLRVLVKMKLCIEVSKNIIIINDFRVFYHVDYYNIFGYFGTKIHLH